MSNNGYNSAIDRVLCSKDLTTLQIQLELILHCPHTNFVRNRAAHVLRTCSMAQAAKTFATVNCIIM